MSKKMSLIVSDGVVTLTVGPVTAEFTEGKIDIDAECNCDDEPQVPATDCPSQEYWSQTEDVKFGFIPALKDDAVQFFPQNDAGEATTPVPVGFWMIKNEGDGIAINFTRGVMPSMLTGLTVSVVPCEEGYDPIIIETDVSGSGLYGTAEGDWQLEAGKCYCVTVAQTWAEPS